MNRPTHPNYVRENVPVAAGAFANASQFVINNSTFTDYSRQDEGKHGLDILRQHVTFSASHDAERLPKPNCSAKTRTRILGEIMNWVNDPDPSQRILWLYGPAGAGKSAIAQTVAELADKAGKLGASFFFSRGAVGRGTAGHLFTTIAYQLAQNVPEIANNVNQLLKTRPELPTKSLDIQFKELVANPALRYIDFGSSRYIGIDGVDECQDENAQEAFLKVIGDVLRATINLPLRFMISSRPEPHIHRLFKNDFFDMTSFVVLEESRESLRDVRTYLQSGFADIYKRNYHSMNHIAQPWPPQHIIDTLCTRSSGHFIYAATVLKFVGERMSHPVTQLAIIMQPFPARRITSPYSDLDQLYLQVLSTHPRPSELVDILGYFIVVKHWDLLDNFLDYEPGTVSVSLNGLHSLISIIDSGDLSTEEIGLSGFHHASFQDFLIDAERSGRFYIDLKSYDFKVFVSCVKLIVRCVDEVSRSDYHESELEPPFQQYTSLLGSRYFVHTLYFHDPRLSYRCDDALSLSFHLLDALSSRLTGNKEQLQLILMQLVQSIYNMPKKTSRLTYLIMHYFVRVFSDNLNFRNVICKLNVHSPLNTLDNAYNNHLKDESSSALRSLVGIPGILALKLPLEVKTMAECFCMDLAVLTDLIKQSLPFLSFSMSRKGLEVMVVPSLVQFLKDEFRSVSYYYDYQQQETMLLRQYLQYSVYRFDSSAGWDLFYQVIDISSLSALENNISTFILFLRKFILEEFNKPLTFHGSHSRAIEVKTMLEKIDRKFSYENESHADAIAKICREMLHLFKDGLALKIMIPLCLLYLDSKSSHRVQRIQFSLPFDGYNSYICLSKDTLMRQFFRPMIEFVTDPGRAGPFLVGNMGHRGALLWSWDADRWGEQEQEEQEEQEQEGEEFL